MLNELLAAALLIMTLLLSHLSWHCFKWNRERPEMVNAVSDKTSELFSMIQEGGELLSELCDIIDEKQPGGAMEKAVSSSGISIPELLLNAMISNTPMGGADGTKSEVRPIHEEQFGEKAE